MKTKKPARILLLVNDSRGVERLKYSGVASEAMIRFQMELACEVVNEDRCEQEASAAAFPTAEGREA